MAKALGQRTEHLSVREPALMALEIVEQILHELCVPFKLIEDDMKKDAIQPWPWMR
jgi:hypothetical protein